MKADRTVIVFGVFLFLIGVSVAWNGYGYIEIERGWSMMIAGTIGFCSGLVLIALGLVLRQLQILSASAAQAALFLAKAKSDGVVGQPFAHVESAPVPAEATAEASAPPVAEEFIPEPAEAPEPIPEPESYVSRPPAWMTRASSYATSFAAARTLETPVAAKETLVDEESDWLEKAVAEEVAAVEAEAGPPTAEPSVPEEAPAEPPLHAESEEEPAPEPSHAPEPEPQPAEEAPPAPTPAIVGQYEAHGARYTMYADGSIDAETAHGVYRFASMEELKRFIEQSA